MLLLLAEVAVLTPFAEFSRGPMAVAADGRICSGLLFSLVVLAFLLRQRGAEARAMTGSFRGRTACCLLVHLACYLVFFVWTQALSDQASPESTATTVALIWVLAAAVVG